MWSKIFVCLDKKKPSAQLHLEERVWYWMNLLDWCSTKIWFRKLDFAQNLICFSIKIGEKSKNFKRSQFSQGDNISLTKN